jgi:protein O-mannosyl-transferase
LETKIIDMTKGKISSESMTKFFTIFVYSFLILSTCLVFYKVHNFSFVNYDDNGYVYENTHVLNGLTREGVIWAFTTGHLSNWHPLTWLSLMLDSELFRAASLPRAAAPGFMHLVNLVLHIANTLLLFALLKKMTVALWQSAFVAAAFAIHPMHVESVAWIAERKDVLSALFFLLSLIYYVSYVKCPSLHRYILAVLLFALGLLAKPMLVTLPFVLLLLDYWPLERIGIQKARKKVSIRMLIIEKIPFFTLSVVSSVITFIVQQSGGAMVGIEGFPLKLKLANACFSYTRYIGKMFWPENLAVFYPIDFHAIRSWWVVFSAFLLIIVSVMVIRFGRNQKYLPVGWFWFLGMLIPVIGLVQVGGQSLADRYTYVPYIGLFIMIAWGLSELLSKLPYRKFVLGLSMGIVLLILGICAHRQVSFWSNSVTLFYHAVKVTQNNYVAYNLLGVAYDNLGRTQDAIQCYQHAVRIKPDYVFKPAYVFAHMNLAAAYNSIGRSEDAIESYKQVINIKPDDADAYYNLGLTFAKLGRYGDAIESYRQVVRIKPDYINAYNNLGAVYGKLGRYQDGIESFKQAVKIKPDSALSHFNLSLAYLDTGDKNSAIEEYEILKTLDTKLADKLLSLINMK